MLSIHPFHYQAAYKAGLVLSVALSASSAAAQNASPEALVAALKDGGHVVYIRHASTESDYADQVDAVIGDCATQRVLSAEGWEEAKAIGRAFDGLKIPVGQVLSSEYCRAWQTADLAFGTYDPLAAFNFPPREDYTDADVAAMRDAVSPYLSSVPEAANLVIVAHDDPFEAATGIYPEPQGVAYVIAPSGDSFEVLGRIAADEWPTPS